MAGFGCFAFACAVSVVVLGLFLRMEKAEFYRFYTNLEKEKPAESGERRTTATSDKQYPVIARTHAHAHTGLENPKLPASSGARITRSVLSEIFGRCWLYVTTAAVGTTTTALVYPASTSLVRPASATDSDWHQVYFTQASRGSNF